MLTRRQNAVYRPLVAEAWQAYCSRHGGDVGDSRAKDAWYREQLVDALGIYTTKQVRDADEFDRLLLHFATIAGNDEWIDRASRGPERRALWRLRKTMKNAGEPLSYVYGIARHMGYDLALEELPAEAVLKINTALYKHWKRKTGAASHGSARTSHSHN